MNLLFDIEAPNIPVIDGLEYRSDVISQEDEAALIGDIDRQPWLSDLKRRVQHYGYRYDYKARAANEQSYLGPLPDWLAPSIEKLDFTPDQAIVNEYRPGQGIAAYIDCAPCFGDTIASLSLGAGTIMQFTHLHNDVKEELYLQPRSLLVLRGPARYEWRHAIPARKSDIHAGFKIPRERRLSVTFRTMRLA